MYFVSTWEQREKLRTNRTLRSFQSGDGAANFKMAWQERGQRLGKEHGFEGGPSEGDA